MKNAGSVLKTNWPSKEDKRDKRKLFKLSLTNPILTNEWNQHY